MLAENIETNPGSENGMPEGTRDIAAAFHRGEDVTNYKVCAFCDKKCDRGYSCSENCDCSIWRCNDCDGEFCESCFKSEVGEIEAEQMFNGEESEIRCPNCFQAKKNSICGEISFKIGDYVFTSSDALIPNAIGKIVDFADDDYPDTTEHFIVDFEDDGTCTVHKNDMSYTQDFPLKNQGEGCV